MPYLLDVMGWRGGETLSRQNAKFKFKREHEHEQFQALLERAR